MSESRFSLYQKLDEVLKSDDGLKKLGGGHISCSRMPNKESVTYYVELSCATQERVSSMVIINYHDGNQNREIKRNYWFDLFKSGVETNYLDCTELKDTKSEKEFCVACLEGDKFQNYQNLKNILNKEKEDEKAM